MVASTSLTPRRSTHGTLDLGRRVRQPGGENLEPPLSYENHILHVETLPADDEYGLVIEHHPRTQGIGKRFAYI